MLLPWGSLLRAVAGDDEASLRRLRGLCAPGTQVEIVVGDDGLPSPDGLPERYREAGFEVSAERLAAAEVADLGTTWAKRLARSDRERPFWRLSGVASRQPGEVASRCDRAEPGVPSPDGNGSRTTHSQARHPSGPRCANQRHWGRMEHLGSLERSPAGAPSAKSSTSPQLRPLQ